MGMISRVHFPCFSCEVTRLMFLISCRELSNPTQNNAIDSLGALGFKTLVDKCLKELSSQLHELSLPSDLLTDRATIASYESAKLGSPAPSVLPQCSLVLPTTPLLMAECRSRLDKTRELARVG